MNTATSRDTFRKMALLRQEVVAAIDHGPRGHIASVLRDVSVSVVMWDAQSLAREILPELSLHFSRVIIKGEPVSHALHYVLVRSTNEVIDITEPALESWLLDNAGVQREMQLTTAIESIRMTIDSLSPESKKRAYRHLRLLNQELSPS